MLEEVPPDSPAEERLTQNVVKASERASQLDPANAGVFRQRPFRRRAN